MPFQLSPGIVTTETSLGAIVPAVATTGGAFVGDFLWGPVLSPQLISSELALVDRFSGPGANNYESWFSAANFLAYGNNERIVRVVDTAARNANALGNTTIIIRNTEDYEANGKSAQYTSSAGIAAGRYPGDLGNHLKYSLCPSANAYSNTLTATANVTSGNTTVIFSANVQTVLTVGDYIAVGSNDTLKVSAISNTNVTVAIAPSFTAVANTVVRSWEYASQFNGAPGTSAFATARGGANDEIHVVVVDADGKITGTAGTILEKYPYLSKASNAKNPDGTINFYVDAIERQSRWVFVTGHPSGATNWGSVAENTTFTLVGRPSTYTLTGGVDSGTPTTGQIEAGWDLFLQAEKYDVGLLVTGPWSATIGSYVIQNIAEVRKDCVAFVSPNKSSVVQNVGSEADAVVAWRQTLPLSSSYGVADCNWKYQYDKYNDTYRWVPVNGDIAGLCARTDMTNDPWWSPGGTTRGQIKNCVKLAWNPNQADRDTIYPAGVNPVVTFANEGTILYGDKTMLAKPDIFDRINVRRLFIVLEKSIAKASRTTLFEFNDEFTRAGFKSMVEPFLRDVKGRRGISDFLVICDASNNTAQVINSNSFVGSIIVRPAHSINFITLNFVAAPEGVLFEEIIGRGQF